MVAVDALGVVPLDVRPVVEHDLRQPVPGLVQGDDRLHGGVGCFNALVALVAADGAALPPVAVLAEVVKDHVFRFPHVAGVTAFHRILLIILRVVMADDALHLCVFVGGMVVFCEAEGLVEHLLDIVVAHGALLFKMAAVAGGGTGFSFRVASHAKRMKELCRREALVAL